MSSALVISPAFSFHGGYQLNGDDPADNAGTKSSGFCSSTKKRISFFWDYATDAAPMPSVRPLLMFKTYCQCSSGAKDSHSSYWLYKNGSDESLNTRGMHGSTCKPPRRLACHSNCSYILVLVSGGDFSLSLCQCML